MTTEIAILNKTAVALAADSAVSISRRAAGSSITKIYAQANKLFELIKGAPVGIMIYNNAEIAGIPWETLIKVYRTGRNAIRYDTLTEYCHDFLTFAEQEVSRTLDGDLETNQLRTLLTPYYRVIIDVLEEPLGEVGNKLDRRKLLARALTQFQEEIDALPILPWAEGLNEASLWRKWHGEIVAMLPDRTNKVVFTVALKKQLARLLLASLLRENSIADMWSGLVVAGFGEQELFPSVAHLQVFGIFERRLISSNVEVDSISNERTSIIEPYAQTGEARMFLNGIDPAVSNAVHSFWQTWTTELHRNVRQLTKDILPNTSRDELHQVSDAVQNYTKRSWQIFADYMNDEFHSKRLGPIEASASFLSKGEIADLAENLVDLTSLRNRVSLDRQETVGGATDVAVISRGDGFVWIKRKHYFERDRNPTWGLQQALLGVLSDAKPGE